MSKNKIIVVGLGSSQLEQLPVGVYRILTGNIPVFLRTKEHPVVEELEEEGFTFQSFDHIYESHNDFEGVYTQIVEELVRLGKEQTICYAVPGHPLVAERTVQLLLDQKDDEIQIELAGGQSFLDALFQSLRIDPIDGFQLLDGTAFGKEDVQLQQHIIIGQVYDAFVASNVKLELLEILPESYEVYIVSNAGGHEESIKKVPLHLLDHQWTFSNLTSLYIPPVQDEEILYKDFNYLRKVIATLRGPNGCPWDKKQTHQSLKRYLIEEAYELLEAIDEEDDFHIVEELGDVLLQVMLHAQIGEDEGYFTIEEVIESLTSKMIRRHPHVFSDVHVVNADEVTENWQKIKAKEKGQTHNPSLLKKVGEGLPALMHAYELQKTAQKVGFDWDTVEPIFDKVIEELNEIRSALNGEPASLTKEIGDLLFTVVNLARKLSIHPEEALISCNQKFKRRFQFIEERLLTDDKTLSDTSLEELDKLWEEAKNQGL